MRHSTRSPKKSFAFDLHVLSTPPAFVLSQDQTLQFDILKPINRFSYKKSSLCLYPSCPGHNAPRGAGITKMPINGPVCCCCYSVVKDRPLPWKPQREAAKSSPIYSSAKPESSSFFHLFRCHTSWSASRHPFGASSSRPRQTT